MKKFLLILGGVILSLSASAGGNSTKCLYVKAIATPTGAGKVYLHGKKKYNESNEGEDAAERKCIWDRTPDFAEEAFIKAVRGENGSMPGVDCTGTIGRYEFILNNQPEPGYEFVCYSNVLKTEPDAIYFPSECYALIHGDGAQYVDFNYQKPESDYDTYYVNGDNHWINGNVSDDIKPKNSPMDDTPEKVFASITEENQGDYFSAEPDRVIYAIFRPIGASYPRFVSESVYFIDMAGWDDVRAYAWNTGANGETIISNDWPGSEMEDAGVTNIYEQEMTTYKISFPESPQLVIFNNNDNGYQTGDMTYIPEGRYAYDGLTETSKFMFLDGDEEFTIAAETPIQGMSMCYPRFFEEGKKTTVCLPFPLNEEQAAAAGTFYKIVSYTNGQLVFDKLEGAVAANTPYVFEAASAYPFEDIFVETLPVTELQELAADDGSRLLSTLKRKDYQRYEANAETTFFAFDEESGEWKVYFNGFGVNYATVVPFHAIAGVPNELVPEGLVNGSVIPASYDGSSTGIKGVENAEGVNNGAVYDLGGRRVSPSSKGVRITEGKKYINK